MPIGGFYLVVLDGRRVLYVEKLKARRDIAVKSQVGRRLPRHATCPGKVLLAHAAAPLPDEVQ
jgi:DNA-binding IclR family transcriptional regulator